MSTELTSTAAVATQKPAPYMRQLCKHFGHRTEAEFGEDGGFIQFEAGRCELRVQPGVLRLTVSAASPEGLARLREVVGSHLERFGRRDSLAVRWEPGGS